GCVPEASGHPAPAGLPRRFIPPAVSVRETLRSNSSLRLQNTRPELPRRPQRRRPSLLVTFVNEVLSFQTAERVLPPQLADSVDGLANGLLESFPSGANCLLGD